MAYLSHSPYRWGHELKSRNAAASLVARSALVAVMAGAVIVALSGAARQAEQPLVASASKGDRIASPTRMASAASVSQAATGGQDIRRDASGEVVYVNDPQSRSTTVTRGATIGLSSQSPLAHQAN